jgi:hypothetical protein
MGIVTLACHRGTASRMRLSMSVLPSARSEFKTEIQVASYGTATYMDIKRG